MEQPDFLITSMQEGNERAFSKLYTKYSEAIYGIIYSIVLDDTIAEGFGITLESEGGSASSMLSQLYVLGTIASAP